MVDESWRRYTPLKATSELKLVEYEPVQSQGRDSTATPSILNPSIAAHAIDFVLKQWIDGRISSDVCDATAARQTLTALPFVQTPLGAALHAVGLRG